MNFKRWQLFSMSEWKLAKGKKCSQQFANPIYLVLILAAVERDMITPHLHYPSLASILCSGGVNYCLNVKTFR